MPKINPTSASDLSSFIEENREAIENFEYDVSLEASWIGDLPESDLLFLARYCHSSRRILAQAFGTPALVFDTIFNNYIRSYGVIELLSSSGSATVEKLEAIVDLEDGYSLEGYDNALANVARHYAATPDLLRKIVRKHPHVRATACCHLYFPESLLDVFSRDDDKTVRCSVASNPNCPASALSRLSRDRDSSVREAVAENAKVSPEVLVKMTQDTEVSVREAVVRNQSVSNACLARLARDPDSLVRISVARNARCPRTVLDELSGDRDPGVRCEIAANKSASPELLNYLAEDNAYQVKLEVASNESSPEQALRSLARDYKESIREAVVRNKASGVAVLKRMTGDRSERIRSTACQRLMEFPLERRSVWHRLWRMIAGEN